MTCQEPNEPTPPASQSDWDDYFQRAAAYVECLKNNHGSSTISTFDDEIDRFVTAVNNYLTGTGGGGGG